MSDKLSLRYSIYLLEGRSPNISSIVNSMFINPSSLSKSGYLTKVCPTILFKQLYNTSLEIVSEAKKNLQDALNNVPFNFNPSLVD